MDQRQKSIPLGRILGIPIGLDLSWFLVFALLTWSLASDYYPTRFASWSGGLYWAMGAVTAIALFASVLLHELGHAVAAKGFRVPVRRIRLMIFGGVAELGDQSPSATSEFVIALAGPLVSIMLAAGMAVTWLALQAFDIFDPLIGLLGYLASVNLMLAVFNMVPGFPLDGGRVLRAIVWGVTDDMRKATVIAASIGRIVGFAFIALGAFQLLTGSVANGLWLGFIGLFLQNAAASEVQAQALRDLLSVPTVSQVMRRNFATVSGETTLQRLADSRSLGYGHRVFVVTQYGQVAGLLTSDQVWLVPSEEWPSTTVAQIMAPIEQLKQLSPETRLWVALQRMELEQVNQLPVVSDGHLLGLLRREDVFSFLRAMQRPGMGLARS